MPESSEMGCVLRKWINDLILFSFCRQSSNPEQLRRTARETREFYKNYKRRKRRGRRS